MGTRTPGSFSSLLKGFATRAAKNELKNEGHKLATFIAGATPLNHAVVGKAFLMALQLAHPLGIFGAIAVGGYAIYKGIKKYEETKNTGEAARAAGVTPSKIGEFAADVATARVEIKNSVIPEVCSGIKEINNRKDLKTVAYNVLSS